MWPVPEEVGDVDEEEKVIHGLEQMCSKQDVICSSRIFRSTLLYLRMLATMYNSLVW